jgi:double-stranded uracil-DNA glycosylase
MRRAAPATRTAAAAAANDDPAALKRCFSPVVDERTRLIVLGSLPGEIALARGQYYGNPQNHFWRLMSAVIELDLVPLGYEERLAALLRRRVGLWDTIASARRDGALDAAIRDHRPNALPDLVATLPSLRAIGFNGKTSARIGRKALGETRLDLVDLPSSSPAFTIPFERKREEWMALRAFL